MNIKTKFSAFVPFSFEEQMIAFWMSDEGMTRDEAMKAYCNVSFKALKKRIAGTRQNFKPDLGYADKSIDGTLCFEIEDDNVVIPINILDDIE
jgi:hypothetical protein